MSDDRVMEAGGRNGQDGGRMNPLSVPRRPRAAPLVLLLIAALAVIAYATTSAPHARSLVGEGLVAGTNLIAAVTIWVKRRSADAWRSSRYLAIASAMIALAGSALFVQDVRHRPIHPGVPDLLFLLFLIPILGAVHDEYVAHFPRQDRRELAIDAALIAASLAAICYVLIRPAGALTEPSISAGTFSILAAVMFAAFGVLTLWLPSRAHLAQAVILSGAAGGTVALGWQWGHGLTHGTHPAIDITFILVGPLLAATTLWWPVSADPSPVERPIRLARPLLTSASVVSACAALATVGTLDGVRGLSGVQSSAIIAVLGAGVAARILANQIRSTQAHNDVHRALGDKEQALSEADMALDRVRETNETLRQSEEHLRLVFEAAVDGIVELDERDTILRVNEAFCHMVRIEADAIIGLPWSALAASVSGADDSFASLPATGEGTIQRTDGQPLYLESRISDVPMTPRRRLLLIRDITSARIADQTIRSLFKFLQDRDEDRTRLLRRTNSAIEAERNRIARDLHDGPVQGVSAASLSLEAALLMIKAGDTDRGVGVLTKIRKELAEEADGLRALMSGLRPPLLEERGLIPAIRETLARFGTEHGVHTEFSGALSSDIPDDLETLAYHVVQEALSNAAKHARAQQVSVGVGSDQVQLRVEIADDGVGFESTRAREFLRMGRVGLASMRERVELASGTFVVRSTPGRGTTIVATLPVDIVPVGRELSVNDAT
jgi:PAS domain S-box-containing protein